MSELTRDDSEQILVASMTIRSPNLKQAKKIMGREPDSEDIKEVYARFGLAYYYAEVLHRGLCNLYLLSQLPPTRERAPVNPAGRCDLQVGPHAVCYEL
jgi:hypothetical protein